MRVVPAETHALPLPSRLTFPTAYRDVSFLESLTQVFAHSIHRLGVIPVCGWTAIDLGYVYPRRSVLPDVFPEDTELLFCGAALTRALLSADSRVLGLK